MFDLDAKHTIIKNRDAPWDIEFNYGITIFYIICANFMLKWYREFSKLYCIQGLLLNNFFFKIIDKEMKKLY